MNLKYKLHILSGPKQGSFFNVQNKKLSLGRGSDNDINLDFDPNCSRKHAVIEYGFNNSISIYNVSSNNKVTINDKVISSQSILKDSDNFTIGKTSFKIEVPSTIQSVAKNSNQTLGGEATQSFKKKSSNTKYIFIAGIALVLFFVLMPSKKKKKQPEFTSFQNIEKEIKSIKEQTTKLYNQQKKDGVRDQLYKKSQIFYLSGFREYRQGKYQNATSSFQACLSLIPTHKLCNRYIILARRKFLELVQYHMLLGQKYLKQHQNKACKTAFRNVMIMLDNKNNNIHKEAKINFQLCALRLKGQY
ncbi:MAG: FHA domain-containing protein [Bdellovibrionales bacterium]|nr:FHA domain-containing protein [Bdellovibrionales bacterium]